MQKSELISLQSTPHASNRVEMFSGAIEVSRWTSIREASHRIALKVLASTIRPHTSTIRSHDDLHKIKLLLMGHFDSPHVGDLALQLQREPPFESASQQTVRTVTEAIATLESGDFVPDLVIVYQGIPDEYPGRDVERLIGLLPFCRFVVAFGPWCESMGRTEQHWPAVWTVPLRNAAGRIRHEIVELQTHRAPRPATSSRDEAFSGLAAERLATAETLGTGLSASVRSADRPQQECVETTLVSLGFAIENEVEADLCVIVATLITDSLLREVKEQRQTNPDQQIIMASDMATPGDHESLLSAGASAVVSQLRFSEDLIDLLAVSR